MFPEPTAAGGPRRRALRHPAEVPFSVFMAALNLVIVRAIAGSAVKVPLLPAFPPHPRLARGVQAVLIGLLPVPGLLLVRELRGAAVGGAAVAPRPSRCPELYDAAAEFAERLRLPRRPEIFLSHGHGRLTAFAGRASGCDYVVLPHELLAGPNRSDPGALRFILGHEMGHIHLHHESLWYRIAVAYSERLPLLGPALSRLREYSCDRYGAYLSAEGEGGLVLVASVGYTERGAGAGRTPRRRGGFWAGLTELSRSHPSAVRRLEQLRRAGLVGRCGTMPPSRGIRSSREPSGTRPGQGLGGAV